MNANFRSAFPVADFSQSRYSLQQFANSAMEGAARFWFGVTVAGQLIFAFTIASFYGMAAVRGNSAAAWSGHFTHGYVPGDLPGNFAVATHLVSAVIVILAGVMQLIPQVRERAPFFHRWNGRL